MASEGWSWNISSTFSIRHILLCFMVSHLLFWTVFKNSQTSLWKQKQIDPKTACEFPEDLRDARIDNEGCRKMLLSSLADRMNLYEDHFHTVINNSDKHGRSPKHETTKVERCFERMNGSEKTSSEAPSGCSSIEKKAIDSGWSLFCCRCTGSNPNFSIYKNAWRAKPAFYRRETNNWCFWSKVALQRWPMP